MDSFQSITDRSSSTVIHSGLPPPPLYSSGEEQNSGDDERQDDPTVGDMSTTEASKKDVAVRDLSPKSIQNVILCMTDADISSFSFFTVCCPGNCCYTLWRQSGASPECKCRAFQMGLQQTISVQSQQINKPEISYLFDKTQRGLSLHPCIDDQAARHKDIQKTLLVSQGK